MPRFSGAYTVHTDWVVRGGVGLFYDKPEGNVIFSQVNLPPFVPSVSVENGNLANPLAGAAAAASVLGNISALDPNLDVPRQLQYSLGVQRELPRGHFAEVTYVGNKGPQPALAAEHQHSDVRGGDREPAAAGRAARR